jgi:hypothetical protein
MLQKMLGHPTSTHITRGECTYANVRNVATNGTLQRIDDDDDVTLQPIGEEQRHRDECHHE